MSCTFAHTKALGNGSEALVARSDDLRSAPDPDALSCRSWRTSVFLGKKWMHSDADVRSGGDADVRSGGGDGGGWGGISMLSDGLRFSKKRPGVLMRCVSS